MNLAVQCSGCGALYRVMQTPDGADVSMLVGSNSEFWPDKYECPRCGASCLGLKEEMLPRAAHTVDIIDLTPEEMLAALHGLGLPEDHNCDIVTVNELLTTKRIKSLVGTNVTNTGRCCIDHLILEDGTKVHLGASTHGAVVYRVVRPHAKKLEDL